MSCGYEQGQLPAASYELSAGRSCRGHQLQGPGFVHQFCGITSLRISCARSPPSPHQSLVAGRRFPAIGSESQPDSEPSGASQVGQGKPAR